MAVPQDQGYNKLGWLFWLGIHVVRLRLTYDTVTNLGLDCHSTFDRMKTDNL